MAIRRTFEKASVVQPSLTSSFGAASADIGTGIMTTSQKMANFNQKLVAFDPRINDFAINREKLGELPIQDIQAMQAALSVKGLYYDTKSPAYNAGQSTPMLAYSLSATLIPGAAEKFMNGPVLKGSLKNSEDIAKLQIALNTMGYESGSVDGSFGGGTAKALAGFYSNHPALLGQMGDAVKTKLAEHGYTVDKIAIAGNPDFARTYLSGIVTKPLPDDAAARQDTSRKMQMALERLGYKPGPIDGHFGEKTATALAKYLQDDPRVAATINGDLRATMEGGIPKALAKLAFGDADYNRTPVQLTGQLLRPDIFTTLRQHPEREVYLKMAMDVAVKKGLDPILYANQIMQESQFNPKAGSYVGALGLGQIMPATGRTLGLKTRADFLDPVKNLEASSDLMVQLTKQLGDQRVALLAYNGGDGAVTWVRGRGADITNINSVIRVINHEYNPNAPINAYKHQTADYFKKITTVGANPAERALAQKLTDQYTATSAPVAPATVPAPAKVEPTRETPFMRAFASMRDDKLAPDDRPVAAMQMPAGTVPAETKAKAVFDLVTNGDITITRAPDAAPAPEKQIGSQPGLSTLPTFAMAASGLPDVVPASEPKRIPGQPVGPAVVTQAPALTNG